MAAYPWLAPVIGVGTGIMAILVLVPAALLGLPGFVALTVAFGVVAIGPHLAFALIRRRLPDL